MVKRIRRLPSPALVIASIALVLAIGGGTFAMAAGDNAKDKRIAKKVANQQITARAPGLSVNHAETATNATNASTVGGAHLGYAHVTVSGATPSVDGANSSPGVTVATSSVASTTCVTTPFTAHAVTGTVDYIADPGEDEIVEATVVTGTGHLCPAGTIEVNTENANTDTGVTVAYYLIFS